MSHFEFAIAEVLRAEGGMLRDSGEGGGGANRGITLTTLCKYRNNDALTLDDLEALTEEEAKLIYRALYWDKLGLDAVVNPLSAMLIMDQAVNRGIGGVKKLLRICVKKTYKKDLADNAEMPELIAAVNEVEDRKFYCRFLFDAQLTYVDLALKNPDKTRWLKGWLIRTHNLLKLLV